MSWVIGASVLAASALVLRWLLGLGKRTNSHAQHLMTLSPDREAIFLPVAQDIQTQCTILGITLNDAFDERNAGGTEIAVRLVQLCAGEWERINDTVLGLLKVVSAFMDEAEIVVPPRNVSGRRFKSRTMTEFFRMYEFLDQLIFRSRLRFQLQVRVLRRANETLSGEFQRNCRYLERTGDPLPELWTRLDLLYHDLDLLCKESLLAFRTFLVCLPDASLPGCATELEAACARAERVLPV